MENESINLSIIVPCYNEQDNIKLFYETLVKTFGNLMESTEIIFINDGSTDDTIKQIRKIYEQSKYKIKVIDFSRNFGKESAMLAGLKESQGKYTAIIDADLQQNPKYILKMKQILDENEDYDAVAAYQYKRIENKLSPFLKKNFYKIMNKITDMEIPESASDFRLLRRNVVQAILSLPERSRFSKGIFAWVGFNTYTMPYRVEYRMYGTSKWNIKKLFSYALDGITDFSVKPLMFSMSFGTILTIFSIGAFIELILMKLIGKVNVSNFVFLGIFMVFILGIQLMSNAIMSKYIAKSYIEVKERPPYIIKEKLNIKEENKDERKDNNNL